MFWNVSDWNEYPIPLSRYLFNHNENYTRVLGPFKPKNKDQPKQIDQHCVMKSYFGAGKKKPHEP